MTSTSLPNTGWTLAQYNLSGATPPLEIGAESYTGIAGTSSTGCTYCRHDKTNVDGLGRVINSYIVNDPDGQTQVDRQYDSNGRVKTVSNPHRGTFSTTDGVETPTYDGLDRSWKVTHADGNVAYTYYGPDVSTHGGTGTALCGNGMGYPVLIVDEAGNKRQTWTDGFGRVIETDEPDSSGTLSAHTCYTYDLNNNLTGVTATGGTQTRSNQYDMISRLTQKTEPESGTTYFYYTSTIGGSTLCSGDPSAVCLRKDARNITASYSYDALNRIIAKSYSDGTWPTYYYYDNAGNSNSKGRLTGVDTYNPGGGVWVTASWFDYDAVGNVIKEQKWVNGVYQTIYYTYNLDGSIATIKYPGGRVVTYTQGNAQRATAVTDLVNNINYIKPPSTGVMYAPPGGLANTIHGYVSGGFAGITESYAYNSRLEVTAIQATSSAGTALNLAYSYVTGNNGNIAAQTNNVTSGRTETYTYDPLNRLLTAQAQATSGGDCWGQSFGNGGPPPTMATDALANLFYTSSIKCSSPAPQYTVNTGNNQFTGTGISYDPAGDMTADTTYTYTYDAENRIITASGMVGGPYCYTYDFQGSRMMKAHSSGGSCTSTVTVDMLYWRNIAGNTIAETDGSGSTTNAGYHEYIFFAGRRMVQSNPSTGSVYHYFADHLGSTRVVTNATGSPCYEADFLPYGTEDTPAGFTNTCSTSYKFTGYERDAETAYGTSSGNDYAFARYYNSRLGRFMSADLLDGEITDPQTLNKYAYVRNNPVNFTDPTGLCGVQDNGPCDQLLPPDPGTDGTITTLNYCFGGGNGLASVTCVGGTVHYPALKASQVKPPDPKPQTPKCTVLQQKAVQLANALDKTSTSTGWLAFASGVATVVAGAGEGFTFGGDTPVTITFGSATAFFTTASTITGGGAAYLNSFARGNSISVANFGLSQLANFAAAAASSKIPGIKPWADRIGDLAGQAADLAHQASEACQ